MLTEDEVYILQEKTDNSFSTLVGKIISLFDNLEYIAYSDEFDVLIHDELKTSLEFRNDINSLLDFHINRVGMFIGIEFENDVELYKKYGILYSIINIHNLIDEMKYNIRDIIESDLDNIEKITRIIELIIDIDISNIYDVINKITDELLENIYKNSVVTDDEYVVVKNISLLIKYNKFIKTINTEPNTFIYSYIKNTENDNSLETMSILFKDILDVVNRNSLLNNMLTLVYFSDVEYENIQEELNNTVLNYVNSNIFSLIEKEFTEKLTLLYK